MEDQMKKATFICMFVLVGVFCFAGIEEYYSFSSNTQTYSDITGTLVPEIQFNDALSNAIPIGFTFPYGDLSFTEIKVSSNGWMDLGATKTSSAYNNSLDETTFYNVLAPFWDDLTMINGNVQYLLSGTAPNRVFTVQYYNALHEGALRWFNFQVKMHESGKIEFHYGPSGYGLPPFPCYASIGINMDPGGSGWFYSIDWQGNASTTSEYWDVPYTPNNGRIFEFIPTPIPAHDLHAISLSGPLSPPINATSLYSVTIRNRGLNTEDNYHVKLICDQVALTDSIAGPEILPGQIITVYVPWAPNVLGSHILSANVSLNDDQNLTNDQTPSISVNVQGDSFFEVTIGDGNTLQDGPISFYKKTSLYEVIYTATELGIADGVINGVQFYYSFQYALSDKPIAIWIGETNLDNLSTEWIPASQLTKVFEGNVDFLVGANILNVPFSVPYAYNGQNLVMMIHRPMDTVSFYPNNNQFYAQQASTNRSRIIESYTIPYDPYNPPNSGPIYTSTFYPKATVFYTDGLGYLQGIISNSNNVPIPGAVVSINAIGSVCITGNNGAFIFPYLQSGTYNITVNKDGYLPQTHSISVTPNIVTTQNFVIYPFGLDMPDNVTFLEDESINIDIDIFASYPPDIPVTLSITGNQNILANVSDMTVTLGAAGNWHGSEVLTFTLIESVNNSSVSDELIITVSSVNDTPTINIPETFSFDEDGSLLIDIGLYSSDIDADPLTLSVNGNQNITAQISGMNVSLGALQDWNGTEQVTFTVNDNMGRAVASDAADIIVSPVNDAPTINLPASFTFVEDGFLELDLSQYVGDVDNDNLTLSAFGNQNIAISITGMLATLSAPTNWNGAEQVTFTVDDNVTRYATNDRRALATDTVEIIVTPVNDTPTLVLPDSFTFDEDGSLLIDIGLYSSDIDADPLTLSVNGNQNITAQISGMNVSLGALQDWNGTEQVTFTVNDNMGRAVASDAADIIVSPVNDAPTIVSFLPDQTQINAQMNEIITFSVTVSDIDSNITISWFVNDIDQGNSTNEFSYQFTQSGTYTVKASIADEDFSIEQIWTVILPVANVDDTLTPTITRLYQNYPNPFNPTTSIRFSVKESGPVNIAVFDIKGRLVRQIVNQYMAAGTYNNVWDGMDNNNNPSSTGIYLIKMKTPDSLNIVKACMVK